MSVFKNYITSIIVISFTEMLFGQGLPIEVVAREVNRQIFDTDGQLPGFYTLTNKYHEFNYGKIKSETIVRSSPDERVIRDFNQQGSMVKYQVYSSDKLRSDFTYEYEANGISLLKERGSYNLDYFRMDSITYYGLTVGDGKGFNFGLDSLFLQETKSRYQLIRKFKPKDKAAKRYEFQYSPNGSMVSVAIFKNNIQTGHILNQYNNQNQVTERQYYTDYNRFATGDEWSEYINSRVNKFQYDSIGLIQTLTTEIYNADTRKWEVEIQDIKCSLQNADNKYITTCLLSGDDYIKIEIDHKGNWVRKEEFSNTTLKVVTREILYYE